MNRIAISWNQNQFHSDTDADAADAGAAAGATAAKLVFRRLDFDNQQEIPFARIWSDLKKFTTKNAQQKESRRFERFQENLRFSNLFETSQWLSWVQRS